MRFCSLLPLCACISAYSPIVNNVGDVPPRDWIVVSRLKTGEACRTSLFGVLPMGGEATLTAAIQNGRIRDVFSVDYVTKNYIITVDSCIRVHGM